MVFNIKTTHTLCRPWQNVRMLIIEHVRDLWMLVYESRHCCGCGQFCLHRLLVLTGLHAACCYEGCISHTHKHRAHALSLFLSLEKLCVLLTLINLQRHEYYLGGRLGVSSGAKVLDCGCGIGGPYRNIAKFTGADITGITINEYQVGGTTHEGDRGTAMGFNRASGVGGNGTSTCLVHRSCQRHRTDARVHHAASSICCRNNAYMFSSMFCEQGRFPKHVFGLFNNTTVWYFLSFVFVGDTGEERQRGQQKDGRRPTVSIYSGNAILALFSSQP